MRTVMGKDAKGTPVFSTKGGLSLRNSNGDIDSSSLGYQRAIDTLTYIKKDITEQIFYNVNITDYIPVVVGEGSFAQNILTNLTVSASGNFEEGIINQGSNNDRLAKANVGISSKTVPVINWAKSIDYTIIEIEQALQANNWDMIQSKHDARKENWDLGIQSIAFLGSLSDPDNVPGLLTQPNVNINTTLITTSLSSMDVTHYTTFISLLLEDYRSNCNRTAYPTHFIMPEDDFNGLVVPYSPEFPMISKLQYLKDAFAAQGLSGVKIMPTAYAMTAYNADYLNKTRYTFLNYNPKSIRMDVPVMITSTQPNTLNNFQFQDAAYGQFTGVWAYRELEMLYFDII